MHYLFRPSTLERDPVSATMSEKQTVGPELLSIEQAMERLENLVREMESGQLPLEQLITSYEEGVAGQPVSGKARRRRQENSNYLEKFLRPTMFGGFSSRCR